MSTAHRTLLALPLALGILGAAAVAQESDTTLEISTVTEGNGGYFLQNGSDARNPTLNLPANTDITIILTGTDGGVHNIQVEGSEPSDYVSADGETIEYTFTSPEAGTYEYWCVPHRYVGMAGTVEVGDGGDNGDSGDGGDGGGEGNDTPGVPAVWVLAAAGAVLAVAARPARRR